MEAYTRLTTEEEKRIFLRDEMTKHNISLAQTAKNAGVQAGVDYAIFQNHGYKGLSGGLDVKDIIICKTKNAILVNSFLV